MNPNIILFYSEHLNLQTKLFNNELTFPSSIPPNKTYKEKFKKQL